MGYYVNPSNMTKEQWIEKNALTVREPMQQDFLNVAKAKEQAYLCLVNNGMFTACAVCYDASEYREFTLGDDNRPKTWYIVERAKLAEVVNDFDKIRWEF